MTHSTVYTKKPMLEHLYLSLPKEFLHIFILMNAITMTPKPKLSMIDHVKFVVLVTHLTVIN